MSDHFDPYYTWLGIPPEEQPPDHYRLIGPDGTLVAIASGAAGRLAPDKVFVSPPTAVPVA